MSDFIHIHTHTDLSLLDGQMKTKDLIARCKELGMSKIAVTNHGNMINMPKIINEAAAEGIQVIPGCEFYITWDYACTLKDTDHDQRYHFIALATNTTGYKNLSALCSIGHVVGKYNRPRVDKELIEKYKEGLIFTTACISGVIGRRLKEGISEDQILEELSWLKEVLDGQIYFELQRHPDVEFEKEANDLTIKASKLYNIPLIVGGDAHYASPNDHEAWSIMMKLATGGKMGVSIPNDYYLKSEEEMRKLFSDVPEAIENAIALGKRCEPVEFNRKYILPQYSENDPSIDLRNLMEEGFQYRVSKGEIPEEKMQEYKDRMEMEYKVICDMGFPGYFLIVADFLVWCKKNKIRVGEGRGSAAGSLVCWLMRITEVDSIKYGLMFERFLNPFRVTMPDIDCDIQDDKRDFVKKYLEERYGEDKVASIMTLGTMAAKGAIRDVCRMLGIDIQAANTLAKAIPDGKRGKNVFLNTIGDPKSDSYSADFMAVVNSKPEFKKAFEIARKLEKTTRSFGVHASGYVISDDKPLMYHCPLMLDKFKNPTTQYTMDICELVGLIKFDLLGLSTERIISDTESFIHKHTPNFNIDEVPLDDEETYKLMATGNSAGLFQLGGTSGFISVTTKLSPSNIEEMADVLSLYRPGPLDNGFIEYYYESKTSGKIKYMIEVEEESMMEKVINILKPTYGVIIYQEQLMALTQVLAGFSLADADLMRRAMGKKDLEKMKKEESSFISGCLKNGLSEKSAKEVWAMFLKFSDYGFNKSHAVAYALKAYKTAYLKAHYPVEFMSALLTERQGKRDDTIKYLNDCRHNGLTILPPCVNESGLEYTPVTESKSIRFGLGAIKELGDVAVRVIQKERAKGVFKSFFDFIKRINLTKVNSGKLNALIRAGALDSL